MSTSGRKPKRLVADRRYPRKTGTKPGAGGRPRKRKPARPRRRRGPLGWLAALVRFVLRLVFRTAIAATVAVTLIVGAAVLYTQSSLPAVETLLDGRAQGSVTLLDREGRIFARRGDQFGGVVTADSVSPHLRNAVIATEDRRFYGHLGVSPRGIASAIRINLSEGRGPLSGHGGSTITQQTAKLLCLGEAYDPQKWESERDYIEDCRRTSLSRKGREALYAMAMEAEYTKDEILSVYLNRAYMGAGSYGAEAASQVYFSKPASELNPAEAAMLAGLLTAPTRLAPTSDLERSQARAATVLRLMNDQGYLTDAETARWQDDPATLARGTDRQLGGYFADWVMQSGPEFFTSDTMEDVVIHTTLDQKMQAARRARCGASTMPRSAPDRRPRWPWWSCRRTGRCAPWWAGGAPMRRAFSTARARRCGRRDRRSSRSSTRRRSNWGIRRAIGWWTSPSA